jgi:hypothetical protein
VIHRNHPEYARVYSKGYNAGRGNLWPLSVPIKDDPRECAAVIRAARELRNAAEDICTSLCDDDEFALKLSPLIDRLDAEIALYNSTVLQTDQKSTQNPHSTVGQ